MDLPNVILGMLYFVIGMTFTLFIHLYMLVPVLTDVLNLDATDPTLYYFMLVIIFFVELVVMVVFPLLQILKPNANNN